tara:strand:+ start:406 stop:732 length:327 start_codon:yes stop_codon:yes gene_type:complete
MIGFKYIFFTFFFEINFIFINNNTINVANKKHEKILIDANKNFFKISSEPKGFSICEYKNIKLIIVSKITNKNLVCDLFLEMLILFIFGSVDNKVVKIPMSIKQLIEI